jgi:DNA-binding LacI/PurR family transcriptional regulator
MLAFGLLAGFREAGLVVPDDVSVIGMDGLFLSSLTSPGLSTVSLPVPEMARTIVERMIARLADPTIAPGEFLFKPALVRRESVGVPPRAARAKRP